MLIQPHEWRPIDIEDLEPAAWDALRHPSNATVVAGPGAGKTEFLAQRACYLLQTGVCPTPRRILAISFKTDAAKNLRSRVRARVHPAGARRFDSMTFDSFTKQLLDRFVRALPAAFRLELGYELAFLNQRSIDFFLSSLAAPPEWAAEVASISRSAFEPAVVGSYRLPVTGVDVVDGTTLAIREWWRTAIPESGDAHLTFTHVNRLAELIVRTTWQVRSALQATYPFVFIDECQDTTVAQFDFVTSLFADAPTVVTAVGDAKQRIMGWAGAIEDAIGAFAATFNADRFDLIMNHRSVPQLVQLQRFVALALEPAADDGPALPPLDPGPGTAEIWVFQFAREEASAVAQRIAELLADDPDLKPGDCALLVRQTPDVFEPALSEAFASLGLSVRNESEKLGRTTLQDLLLEELALLVVGMLRLVTLERSPADWTGIGSLLRDVWGVDPYDAGAPRAVDDMLSAFILETRAWLTTTEANAEAADELMERILGFVGRPRLRTAIPSYRTGDAFEIAEDAARIRLEYAAGCGQWTDVADAFVASGSVPILTVHKSKGLEYKHVFFLGIDDKLWWAHSPGEPEGVSTFFVGLSRARLSARFTFCHERGTRTKVADLYGLLRQAGVPEVTFE